MSALPVVSPVAGSARDDVAAEAVLVVDLAGRCVAANPAAAALLGYEPTELLQIRLNDLIARGPRWIDGDRAQELTARPWRETIDVRRRDGCLTAVDAQSTMLTAMGDPLAVLILRRAGDADVKGGRETRAAQTALDPETMDEASRALQESQERFRGAFDASSIGMALVARDGRFLQVNPALCDIVGYGEAELLARSFAEITHVDDRDIDGELVERLLRREIGSYQIEKRYLCKDARQITGRLTVSLVRDARDEPRYFVAQIQDITPYKAAGAALREAEARYRTLVEQIPAAVYADVADALGTPQYISPRIELLLGYTPEEWVSDSTLWMRRLHPDDRERVLAAITVASETEGAFNLEYRFLARDGRVVWVHDEAGLVRDDEGAASFWHGFMIDITARKQQEEELRAAKEAAEEASRLKTTFLSTATHELRTPLTVISGYIELLAGSADSHLTAEQREFIDIAQASTKTLSALVDDLLDLARIEADRMELTMRAVDIADTVTRVHRMVAAQAASKGIGLDAEIAADVPLVAADPNRLIQVLLNLVGNAVKFTEQGSVRSVVRPAAGGVEIRVIDTGIGIPPEALPRIFDEFRQADAATTRKFGGTGLGLAIAKRLIELHGGTIAVESASGGGSTFRVWLPAAGGVEKARGRKGEES